MLIRDYSCFHALERDTLLFNERRVAVRPLSLPIDDVRFHRVYQMRSHLLKNLNQRASDSRLLSL